MNSALKIAAALLSVAVIIASGTGITGAFLVSRAEPVDNTFISGIEPYGSLTVSKTVEHPYGRAYVIPDSKRFSFEVDLGGETVELELAAGESVTIDDIPVSAGIVTVTEKDIPAGFTPEGGASKEVRIVQAEDARADFVNVYAPAPADNDLSVRVTKTLEGRGWKDSDEFIFMLEELRGGEWRRISEESASKGRRTVDFSGALRGIVFSEAGTYKFRVREDEGSAGGVTYDRGIRYFDVIVADDDMDGRLEIKSPERIEIGFTNSYAPQGSAAVDIDIIKTMSDASYASDTSDTSDTPDTPDTSGQSRGPEGFRFGLYDGDRLIALSNETSAAGMAAIRQVFGPDDTGAHRLTLKEMDDGEPGVVYDTKVYELAVTVIDNGDGTVSAFVYDWNSDCERNRDGYEAGSVPPGATDCYEAEFFNTYDHADAALTLEGIKRLEGRNLRPGEFRFGLYETGPGYDSLGIDPAETVTNGEDGRFAFDLTYSRAGTYYYVIKEEASGLPVGVSCDSTEYHVRVDVSDVGGILKAEYAVTDAAGILRTDPAVADTKGNLRTDPVATHANGHDSDIVFINTYTPAPSITMLSGTKLLKGRAVRDGEFSFALYRTDSSFCREELVCETANNRDGSFSFGELRFDREGRYCFSVREIDDSPDSDIEYDSSVYHIIAKVSDDGEGALATDYEITAVCDGTERSADEISFTNVYTGPKHDDGPDSKNPGSDSEGADNGDKAADNNDKSAGARGVRTGDDARLIVWIMLMILSAGGLTAAIRHVVVRRTGIRRAGGRESGRTKDSVKNYGKDD